VMSVSAMRARPWRLESTRTPLLSQNRCGL
jgi:hypothetical protein